MRALYRLAGLTPHQRGWTDAGLTVMMMMIVFDTIKSSLVPLIDGLCAQI